MLECFCVLAWFILIEIWLEFPGAAIYGQNCDILDALWRAFVLGGLTVNDTIEMWSVSLSLSPL